MPGSNSLIDSCPGIPITSPSFWLQREHHDFESNESEQGNGEEHDAVPSVSLDSEHEEETKKYNLDAAMFSHIFRSDTSEEIPLAAERLVCLREAGEVLHQVSV